MEIMLRFFDGLSHVMMKLTNWIIWLAPLGVCSLVAGQIIEMQVRHDK
jgi:Na+/H+-dicarboxylate symporter